MYESEKNNEARTLILQRKQERRQDPICPAKTRTKPRLYFSTYFPGRTKNKNEAKTSLSGENTNEARTLIFPALDSSC